MPSGQERTREMGVKRNGSAKGRKIKDRRREKKKRKRAKLVSLKKSVLGQ